MPKLSKRNKTILILSTCFVFLTNSRIEKEVYEPQITYNEEYELEYNLPFATCSMGNVYIGSEDYINSIRDDNTKDIYIVDNRYQDNPSIRICNSYEINNRNLMKEVINIIEQYELMYPSNWCRTSESMLNEWAIHNISYQFKFKKDHAEHVDLDNLDESKYNFKGITKILRK